MRQPHRRTGMHFLGCAVALIALGLCVQAAAVQVDFLWVIDNSPSMTDKQAVLASTADAIKTELDQHATCELDWRMAVTYTDLYAPPTAADVCPGAPGPGRHRLCPFTKDIGLFRDGSAACAYVKAGSCGDPSEEGFRSANVALDRVLSGTGCEPVPGADCLLRPDARLAVIFMTDSGEQTPRSIAPPGQPDDSIASWVRYFGDFDLLAPGTRRAQVHGLLCPYRPTATNPAPCGDRLPDGSLFDRYSNAIALMGGTEGSIVDTDATQLSDAIMHIVRSTIAGACCGNGVVDPGEQCDDGNVDDGDCCSSKCTFETATTVCRAPAGPCDAAEFCTGTSPTCPADALQPSTFQCRGATGSCDVPELCTGTSRECPIDTFKPAGTLCRAATGACDVAEACTGSSGLCPPDAFRPATTVCRSAAGACDLMETCTGKSAACPADAKSTAVCRAANGPCDVAERCDGVADDCPPDRFQPATTTCRAGSGVCDVAETCTGTSAECPPDRFQPPTTVCRPAAGVCDTEERCSGESGACPPDAKSVAVCRAEAGPCDLAESCDGRSNDCPPDRVKAAGTICRAVAGACDLAEQCDGVAATCPADESAPDGAACDDGNRCTGGDRCVGGLCTPDSLKTCAADQCHEAAACNPATGACRATAKPDGTPCDDGDACTDGDSCHDGRCAGAPHACDDDDACTIDRCDPTEGCVHVGLHGFRAVSCVCTVGLTRPDCTGQRIPPRVAHRFRRACRLVDKAAHTRGARGARLFRKGGHQLRIAQRSLRTASRRQRISRACAGALDGRLASAVIETATLATTR